MVTEDHPYAFKYNSDSFDILIKTCWHTLESGMVLTSRTRVFSKRGGFNNVMQQKIQSEKKRIFHLQSIKSSRV